MVKISRWHHGDAARQEGTPGNLRPDPVVTSHKSKPRTYSTSHPPTSLQENKSKKKVHLSDPLRNLPRLSSRSDVHDLALILRLPVFSPKMQRHGFISARNNSFQVLT